MSSVALFVKAVQRFVYRSIFSKAVKSVWQKKRMFWLKVVNLLQYVVHCISFEILLQGFLCWLQRVEITVWNENMTDFFFLSCCIWFCILHFQVITSTVKIFLTEISCVLRYWQRKYSCKQTKGKWKTSCLTKWSENFFFTLKIFSLNFTNKHPVIYYLKVNEKI